jgi:hypothetical protein
MKLENAFYAQSGGVSAVINASAPTFRRDWQSLCRAQRHHWCPD